MAPLALLLLATAAAAAPPPPQEISAAVDLTSAPTKFAHYCAQRPSPLLPAPLLLLTDGAAAAAGKRCVGSGHMLLGTRADWREHLRLAHDELGFTGVRGHGLLDDDMSVMPGQWGSQAGTVWGQASPYEFYNVDQVYDYLVSMGVKPVVELSFMPKALASCGGADPETGVAQPPCSYAHSTAGGAGHGGYKGLAMPPDNFEDWYALIFALAEHLVQRYGLEEVASWHFEVS